MELSSYISSQGFSISPIEVASFREISAESITLENRDLDNSTLKNLELNLAGARFVFNQYRQILTTIAELKRDRLFTRVQDLGGPESMQWVATEMSKEISKGARAIKMVRSGSGSQ
jgi:hypothetical protein